MDLGSFKRNHSHSFDNNSFLIILVIVLAIILFCVTYFSNKQDQVKSFARENQLRDSQKQEQIDSICELKQNYNDTDLGLIKEQENVLGEIEYKSFYQKLADGNDVNVLLVGDSICAGTGASDYGHTFGSLLKNGIESTYNVSVNLTNISMGGNTSYSGYVRIMSLNDNLNYDLVIICYGQIDDEYMFDLYYESIIKAVKLKYPEASVICVLESSQKEYTNKMQMIMTIADHYNIPVADTIEKFQGDYDNLVADKVHPNDKGNQLYYEAIMDKIIPLVAGRVDNTLHDTAAINEKVSTFETFRWISVDEFTRNGNTFIYYTKINGTILGIDYKLVPGKNSCKISIDGVEYVAPEISFDYDFSQRYIMIVNNWLEGNTIEIKNEIKVEFENSEEGKKQADGFGGLAISGINY